MRDMVPYYFYRKDNGGPVEVQGEISLASSRCGRLWSALASRFHAEVPSPPFKVAANDTSDVERGGLKDEKVGKPAVDPSRRGVVSSTL